MLRLANGYSSTIWAMIEYYRAECPTEDWQKKGWWRIEPGRSAVAFAGDLRDVNLYWYAFAHAADGRVWDGPNTTWAPFRAFDWCEPTRDTNSRVVGMFEFEVTSDRVELRFA